MADDITSAVDESVNVPRKSIEELLKDPKYANLEDDAEVPDELLKEMDGAELTALFVEQLIADKGAEPTDDLRKQLAAEIDAKVSREVVSALPDYMVAQLDKQLDENGDVDDEAFAKMVEEAGIDLDTVTENAMIEFRNEYLAGGASAKGEE